MGNLTKNLSVNEFACDCNYSECKQKLVAHMPLVLLLQDVGDHFGRKYGGRAVIDILDGNRCFKNNVDIQMEWTEKTREEAERSKSRHMYNIAADVRITVNGLVIPSGEIKVFLDENYAEKVGVGLYDNGRTHIDTRGSSAFWDNRK